MKHTQPANTARKAKLISQFVFFSSRHPCVLSQVAFQATGKAPVNMCCRTTSLSSFKPCASTISQALFSSRCISELNTSFLSTQFTHPKGPFFRSSRPAWWSFTCKLSNGFEVLIPGGQTDIQTDSNIFLSKKPDFLVFRAWNSRLPFLRVLGEFVPRHRNSQVALIILIFFNFSGRSVLQFFLTLFCLMNPYVTLPLFPHMIKKFRRFRLWVIQMSTLILRQHVRPKSSQDAPMRTQRYPDFRICNVASSLTLQQFRMFFSTVCWVRLIPNLYLYLGFYNSISHHIWSALFSFSNDKRMWQSSMSQNKAEIKNNGSPHFSLTTLWFQVARWL